VSCGIDLPTAQDCSGNVTPIPTTGELEDLSEVQSCATQGQAEDIITVASTKVVTASEGCATPRAVTPLKSLLKKQSEEPSLEPPDHCNGGGAHQDTKSEGYVEEEEDGEGRYSPKKAVTFSEIDQIKLMSMESLLSTATSDTSTAEGSAISGPIMSTRAAVGMAQRNFPYHPPAKTNNVSTPRRNQVAHRSKDH